MKVCSTQEAFLGYIITQECIKTEPKTSEAIIHIELPKDKKQVIQLLGMVQYYRDVWLKCSEILAPIIELTKGGPTKNYPIEWNSACTESFQKMKSLIAK